MSRFITVLAFVSVSMTVSAADDAGLKARFAKQLEKVLPGVEVTSVAPGPIPGTYEVMMGHSLIYMSDDGRYAIRGDVYDLSAGRNLSDDRRSTSRGEALKALTADSYIEFGPAGATENVIYVYTDIDCTYCRKLHTEVPALNEAGIAVRYLAFPRSGIPSESYDKAVSVWCAADKQSALTQAKAGAKLNMASCDNPVKTHYEMGGSMNVRGTPSIMLESGKEIGGYIPAERLIEFFESRS
ncbi:MAG: DsbC family protein [Gammaproteobacteria bacterium]|nr:DsbC family protein [Gammaproteobacteria bacterium]